MVLDRSRRILKAIVRTLREEGLFGFIKKVFSFFFGYGIYFVYEKSTGNIKMDFPPEIKNYKVKVIESLNGLEKLKKDGYDSKMRDLRIGVKAGAIPFCIFSGKKMVHVTWAMTNAVAKKEIDRVPVPIDFQIKEATTGGSYTDPSHRGKGLLGYAYFHILPYLAKHGFRKIKFIIHANNIPSQKGIVRFNPKLVGKGRYLKFLWLNVWKDTNS